jgi:glucose-6-phosphate isomerase
MSEPTNEDLILDASAAAEILNQGINKAHRDELDARVRSIQAAFAEEQKEEYPTLEKRLRAWTQSHTRKPEIDKTVEIAERIRRQPFAVFVLVGIGGSDLGARTLHDALDHPYHNQLSVKARGGAPEIYFTGDTFDPKRLIALLNLLENRHLLRRTCVNVVSKSGETSETIAAMMIIREWMIKAHIKSWAKHVVATTGQNDDSVLYKMNQKKETQFFDMLPVPEGVGGRFSFASPVGLLPFAVTAGEEGPRKRVDDALEGYEEAHNRFLLPASAAENVACQLARWWQLGEQYGRKTALVFCNYADDPRLGDWFTQLYEESIQERGGGLNVIGTRGPTGNHSILNGILRGPHDKLVLMIHWRDLGDGTRIPTRTGINGDMKYFEGLRLAAVQDASCRATTADYLANGVPTATLSVAQRDGKHLFLLMRTLMDAVAVKGRLQDLHINAHGHSDVGGDLTYRQDGVEGYKVRTRINAMEMQNTQDW